jgi:hypothetical protein
MGTGTILNKCEIARKIQHGHACGFLVSCGIRLRANVSFSSQGVYVCVCILSYLRNWPALQPRHSTHLKLSIWPVNNHVNTEELTLDTIHNLL